ncbi:MAG: hypothetical protein LBQ90_07260 [Synergistaceae bacterium]|nr:hypothetical protein [Synergistaceae bacterium]
MKKVRGFLFFALLLSGIFASGRECAAAPFKVFTKESYPLEDTILTGVEPNVMFFLDTSSSMAMSMKGELPTFINNDATMQAMYPLMRDANRRAEMLRNAAYGTGARPVSESATGTRTIAENLAARKTSGGIPNTGTEKTGWASDSNQTSRKVGYTRWGRDLDNENNIIGNLNCYYTPDPGRPYLLTFRDRNWANWNGQGAPPKANGDGLGDALSHQVTAIDMPVALRAYLPGGANYGQRITNPDLIKYLVPNDSKMYQMKLVLWRLLDREYAQTLAGMRIGAAGNYFDYSTSVNRGPMYRRGPYFGSHGAGTNEGEGTTYLGGDTFNFRATHNGSANQTIAFPHGTAAEAYSGIIGGDYGAAEVVYASVLSTYTTGDATTQRHGARAYMRVPFDYMYTYNKEDGNYYPTDSLIAFRELIDGVEQYNTSVNDANRMVNEELVAGGTAQLATSFYGRDNFHATAHNGSNNAALDNRYAIDYAKGVVTNRELWTGSGGGRGILAKRIRNSEGLMTGTALGSVIDFFSPFGGTNGLTFTQNPTEANDVRGYFPVTGSCQSNWLVVFTGGNDQSLPGRDSLDALKNLYLNSKTMRGRQWDGSKWVHREFTMDSPIRTIFVGLMPPATEYENPDDPDDAMDLGVKRLRKKITKMAWAGQPLSNGDPDRTKQPYFADNVSDLIQTLQSILLQIRAERFASGAPLVLPLYDTGDEKALFAASYNINMSKQWEGTFHKYIVSTDVTVPSVLDWRAEQKMAEKGGNRAVYTSTGMEGEASTSVSALKDIASDAFKTLTGVTSHETDFRNWLITYPGEAGILGDMEHSGITVVNSVNPWRIYIQTNRGVLHSLDYENGDEEWAFIPPNILQTRLWAQKFDPYVGAWYDGDGSAATRPMSMPLALLDGMLATGNARDDVNGGYRTLMIGNLGWGGNGFYAMDVTSPGATPRFLWAVENVRYNEPESNPLDGIKRWGDAAGGNVNEYNYSDLGLTLSAAEIRVTSDDDGGVGILAGGLGYNYGSDSQGKAFYFFDPNDASIIRTITGTTGFLAPPGRTLGMGVAPIFYVLNSSNNTTKEFFTGDSEGNVLYCDMQGAPSTWNMKSIFQLRTVTAPDRPVAITKAFEIGTQRNVRWLFGGTADLMVPDSGAAVPERKLTNAEQFIFGLNLTENPNLAGNADTPLSTTSLVALKYMADSIFPAWSGAETGDQVSVPTDAKGWRLRLRPQVIHATEPTNPEYVTTSPFLYQGVLYVSTFIARTRQPEDDEKCPELGDSKLYALDPTTGKSAWTSGQQAVVFDNIKISGISAVNGRLFLGVKVLRSGALNALNDKSDIAGFRTHADGTTIDIGAMGDAGASAPDVPYNIPLLQYWKERF